MEQVYGSGSIPGQSGIGASGVLTRACLSEMTGYHRDPVLRVSAGLFDEVSYALRMPLHRQEDNLW
jgi:hypothetical protein